MTHSMTSAMTRPASGRLTTVSSDKISLEGWQSSSLRLSNLLRYAKVVAHLFMKLKAGDIRQKGDEVRSTDIGQQVADAALNQSTDVSRPGSWEPVKLLGWPILQSDLMHAEFQRP